MPLHTTASVDARERESMGEKGNITLKFTANPLRDGLGGSNGFSGNDRCSAYAIKIIQNVTLSIKKDT